MTGKKMMSYNTSFANDCHDNQLHMSMSEAPSLLRKAVDLLSKDATAKKDFDNETEFSKKITILETKGNVPNSDDKFKTNLVKLRSYFNDRNTEYIQKCIDDDYEFISLIEQTIHAGAGDTEASHCYYKQDEFKSANLDLTLNYDTNASTNIKNTDYGFLKRLNKLQNVKNVSVNTDFNDSKYLCVFDTVMHIPPKEGIAIIFKRDLVGDSLLKWENKNVPNRMLNITKKRLIANEDENVNLYSADMGPSLCYESEGFNYSTGTGTKLLYGLDRTGKQSTDAGRPLLIAGGVKEKTLVLFISFHGPNFANLKDFIKGQDVNDNDSLYEALIEKFKSSMEGHIENALVKCNSKPDFDNINVYLGCDSNDSKGELLKQLLKSGLKVNFETLHHITFKSSIDDHDIEMKNFSDDLKACCANSDSQNEGYKTNNTNKVSHISSSTDKPFGTTGPEMLELILDPSKYHRDFAKENAFGYFGDYVLFGSSDKTNKYINNMKKKKLDEPLPSDHLPIIQDEPKNTQPIVRGPHMSQVEKYLPPAPKKGGKRRTRRRRSTRRKRRMSRRRRRSTRRKR